MFYTQKVRNMAEFGLNVHDLFLVLACSAQYS